MGVAIHAPSALAGPNAGGTLIVHDTGIAYTNDSRSYPSPAPECAFVDNVIEGESWTVWKVYAAFNHYASPRLKALSWGITLTPGVTVLNAGLPDPQADFEITQGGWPNTDGAGIGMSFGTTQTGIVVECYWFGGYAQFLPQTFGTGEHPFQEAMFVDDSAPGIPDLVAGHSSIGFGQAGLTDCPEVVYPAACCFSDGSCELHLVDICVLQGGTYYGGPCEPNPCWGPPPAGACCFPSGLCAVVAEYPCWVEGGVFYGGECVPNPCPPPPGACCFLDASCVVMPQAECLATGGAFYGGTCIPDPCPQPPTPGACCFPDGLCLVMTGPDCVAAGGALFGGPCFPNPCVPPALGGEDIASATIIEALPFAGAGSTCGHINDYDYACPDIGSTSPDLVYRYEPPSDEVVTINLCASSYDT